MNSYKKIISISLGILLFVSTAASAVSLIDIDGHWAKSEIEKLVEENVINGYDDSTFKPDNPITREEAAKMISVYFDELIKSKGKVISFSDVYLAMWSEKYITNLVDAEIISGYPDGSFKPQNNIKRAEASKMIYEALENTGKYKNNGVAVSLSDIGGHWAEKTIEKLVSMGAIKGYSSGEFRPENDITRAELAKILYNLSIPFGERTSEWEVVIKNFPRAYGIQLNDSQVTKENLESKMLNNVTAVDQDGNKIERIYLSPEDLDRFDKSVEGEHIIGIVFENKKGKKKVVPISITVANYVYEKVPTGVRINSCDSGLNTLAIPEYIEGEPVVELGKRSFMDNETLKKVYISSNCYIGEMAFENSKLEEVFFPDDYTVKSIGEEAFYGTLLNRIIIPKSIEIIEDYAFAYCNLLKEVYIPGNVQTIGMAAFLSSGIEKVTFGVESQLRAIEARAFMSSNIKDVTIPKNVEIIEDFAFQYTPLSRLSFETGSKLNSIGDGLCKNTELSGTIRIPKSIKVLPRGIEIIPIEETDRSLNNIRYYCFDDKVTLEWMD